MRIRARAGALLAGGLTVALAASAHLETAWDAAAADPPSAKLSASASASAAAPATSADGSRERDIDAVLADFYDHGPDAPVMIVSHRGYWRGAPENSLAAIDLAIRKGADVVEIDLQRTSDGHLVLMHDANVNRMTNGTGAIANMTLAQLKQLRLKDALGGAEAPLTDHRVPTLTEAMELVKGRAMVNLDKGWPLREPAYEVLAATGTVDHAIFKSNAAPAQVNAFRAAHPDAVYMHILAAGNAAHADAFADQPPPAFVVNFERLTEPQIHPQVVARLKETSRIWMNSLWEGLAANYTDEASLLDPAAGWGTQVERHGANMIQTDNVEALRYWLDGGDLADWGKLNQRSIRVRAVDYSIEGKGVGYHDQDDQNRGGAARPFEGVDICNARGAIAACWIRAGEWMKYSMTITAPGKYRVSARVGSPYNPAGRFHLEYTDGARSESVDVPYTGEHSALELIEVETRRFDRGTYDFFFRVEESVPQNFNLDYLQFDRIGGR